MTPPHAPVRRFVLDGLRATLTAHTAGTLPLSRLAWELTARLDTLTPLVPLPRYRALTALRTAVHTVATIDAGTGQPGHPLTTAEHRALRTALDSVHTALRLLAEDPTTGGVSRPPVPPRPAATFRPVVLPFPRTETPAANPPGDPASRPPGGDRTPAA